MRLKGGSTYSCIDVMELFIFLYFLVGFRKKRKIKREFSKETTKNTNTHTRAVCRVSQVNECWTSAEAHVFSLFISSDFRMKCLLLCCIFIFNFLCYFICWFNSDITFIAAPQFSLKHTICVCLWSLYQIQLGYSLSHSQSQRIKCTSD